MLQLLATSPLLFFISAIGLIISITIHEFSHAFAADKLGDPTPRIQDRLTLNPLAHLDLFGTISMFIFGFGWGKPVQFDPYNLKDPVKEGALIALAGPASNIILAALISLLLHLNAIPFFWLSLSLQHIAFINIVLAIFNLVPVHPLDGSKILLALLPKRLGYDYELLMNRYGLFLLIAILIPTVQGRSLVNIIITPLIDLVAKGLFLS
jgi:Zn-dependent protease